MPWQTKPNTQKVPDSKFAWINGWFLGYNMGSLGWAWDIFMLRREGGNQRMAEKRLLQQTWEPAWRLNNSKSHKFWEIITPGKPGQLITLPWATSRTSWLKWVMKTTVITTDYTEPSKKSKYIQVWLNKCNVWLRMDYVHSFKALPIKYLLITRENKSLGDGSVSVRTLSTTPTTM